LCGQHVHFASAQAMGDRRRNVDIHMEPEAQ
jgi:hypothetical protein